MHLFSRIATLQGPPADVGAWAKEITDFVGANSDLEPSLWQGVFGYPLGTMVWSGIVEGRAQILTAQAQLMSNPDYLALVGRASEWASPFGAHDTLRALVHATTEPTVAPIGAVANVITAAPANGKLADAIAWGIETADLATTITGQGVGFLADSYGTFGQMSWIMAFDTAAEADAAEEKLNGSAEYIAAITGAADLFIPGSGQQRMIARIG